MERVLFLHAAVIEYKGDVDIRFVHAYDATEARSILEGYSYKVLIVDRFSNLTQTKLVKESKRRRRKRGSE